MNTQPFPYSLPPASLAALHQVQQAAALLGHLGETLEDLPARHQLGGMAAVSGLMAACLTRIADEVDAASRLRPQPGAGA